MFSPLACSDPPPIPIEQFDVERTTVTDADEQKLRQIDDVWDGSDQDCKDLGIPWRGETTFELKPPTNGPPGHSFLNGRWIRNQTSQRPPNVDPENWNHWSKKAKAYRKGEVEQEGYRDR